MSVCERCWREAQRACGGWDVADNYARLMAERSEAPCSPEDQAGPDARECPRCKRKTIHQHTGEPMCGCKLIGWEV